MRAPRMRINKFTLKVIFGLREFRIASIQPKYLKSNFFYQIKVTNG